MDENEYAVETNANEDFTTSSPKRYRIKNAVEIPLLLMMFSYALGAAPISNLILYRTCVHELNHTTVECRPFLSPDKMNYTPEEKGHMKDLEKEVQEYANMLNTVSSVVGSLVPAFLSLFIGVWSNKHGRKPLIVWTLLGMTFNTMLVVVFAMAQSLGPWWLVGMSAFFSLFGGFSVTIIGAMCYITDVTDTDNRTFRLLMIQMIFALGMAGGGMLSPYLLRAVGNVYLFLIVATLHTFAYVFAVVVLAESLTDVMPGSILSVLDLSHIKEMLRECFKKRPNHGRTKILLPIFAVSLSTFVMYGATGLMYLYTRNKLQWTMKDYTTFSSISTVWVLFGFLAVGLLQRLFHISDLSFAALALVLSISESIIKAAATTSGYMYVGSVVALFGSVTGPLSRSFLTKTLSSQDIAKAFSLLGSAESFCPLLAPLVYNALYEFTLASFPGAFLLLSAAIYTVSLIFILIVKFLPSPSVTYQLIDEDLMN